MGKVRGSNCQVQGIDKEMETIRAQLLSTTQDLGTKLSIDEALMKQQSGQVEKMQSTLDEMQTMQSTLMEVMTKSKVM